MSPATNPQAIREQLQRILVSPGIDAALSGRLDDLKEYTIGVAAFDRPRHYDPADDPIVRVEARRLRLKLDEYNNKHGASEPVVIQLRKGGYLPAFEVRAAAATPNRRLWLVMGAVALRAGCCMVVRATKLRSARIRPAPSTFDRGLTTAVSLLVYASDRANNGGLDIWIQPVKQSRTGA